MKYTVVWQRWAEDEITEIWLAASSDERASITEALPHIHGVPPGAFDKGQRR